MEFFGKSFTEAVAAHRRYDYKPKPKHGDSLDGAFIKLDSARFAKSLLVCWMKRWEAR